MLVSSIVFLWWHFATRHLVAISWVAYGNFCCTLRAHVPLWVSGVCVQDLTPLLVTVFAGAATYVGALFIVRS